MTNVPLWRDSLLPVMFTDRAGWLSSMWLKFPYVKGVAFFKGRAKASAEPLNFHLIKSVIGPRFASLDYHSSSH